MKQEHRDALARVRAAADQVDAALAAHPEWDEINDQLGPAIQRVVRMYLDCGAEFDQIVGLVVRATAQHYASEVASRRIR